MKGDLIDFLQRSVRIRSYSGEEGNVAALLIAEMKALGYDEVFLDSMSADMKQDVLDILFITSSQNMG